MLAVRKERGSRISSAVVRRGGIFGSGGGSRMVGQHVGCRGARVSTCPNNQPRLFVHNRLRRNYSGFEGNFMPNVNYSLVEKNDRKTGRGSRSEITIPRNLLAHRNLPNLSSIRVSTFRHFRRGHHARSRKMVIIKEIVKIRSQQSRDTVV